LLQKAPCPVKKPGTHFTFSHLAPAPATCTKAGPRALSPALDCDGVFFFFFISLPYIFITTHAPLTPGLGLKKSFNNLNMLVGSF
jgi:hypothetical protein